MSQFKESAFGDKVKKWWAGRHDRRAQRKLNREGRRAAKGREGYVTQPAAEAKPTQAPPIKNETPPATTPPAETAKPATAAKPDMVSYKKTGTDFQQQAKKTDASTGQTTALSEKTKGGDYKIYGKQSQKAQDFRSAFAAAKKDPNNKGTFDWQGKSYSTKMASFVDFNKQAGFQDELAKLGGLGSIIGKGLRRGANWLWGASPKKIHSGVTGAIKRNPITSTVGAGAAGSMMTDSANKKEQQAQMEASNQEAYEAGVRDVATHMLQEKKKAGKMRSRAVDQALQTNRWKSDGTRR